MALSPSIAFLRKKIRGFERATGGNVAVIFAIALLPVISFVGVAVDYTRTNNARSGMQAAMDSAALMVSRDLGSGIISTSDISATAQKYFNALYTNKETALSNFTAVYTTATSSAAATIKLSGTGTLPTDFMKVAGFPNMSFGISSTTTWGSTKLRVALALDNTGSMASGNKMTALQTSAKKLVATLKATAATPGDVYISVVPFAKDVNVGKSNYTQNWLDWTDWENDNSNQDCDWRGNNCTVNNHNTWNGCVTDRTENYDVTSTAPNTTGTKFPAEQYDACPSQLLPLTYDFDAVNTKIDLMSPNGGTNQPIGLFWAWWTLRSTAPFAAPAKDSRYNYLDAIILLTDGLNTQQRNPNYGNGSTQFNGKIDARQKLLCDAIKADGVTLYTIQVNTDGEATSVVLPYCASSSDKFFILTSATQILSAFDTIGTSLTKLRVSK